MTDANRSSNERLADVIEDFREDLGKSTIYCDPSAIKVLLDEIERLTEELAGEREMHRDADAALCTEVDETYRLRAELERAESLIRKIAENPDCASATCGLDCAEYFAGVKASETKEVLECPNCGFNVIATSAEFNETDARQPVLTQKDVNFCERHQDAFRADEPCPKCTSDTSNAP